ncbi:MAG: glycosyltransferase family 2 protein [Spirochaetes bacterium]|nr:glycosyltransferase family 2 protein [Spirochaetota bacterium]
MKFIKKKHLISILIPVYNERDTIETVVERVKKAFVYNHKKEIIIIDDASSDGTTEILKRKIEKKVSKVIYHKNNMGKGASLRDGIQALRGDIVIIQDADLEYDPDEYRSLLQPILDGRADVVYGSRFIGARPHRVVYFWHKVGNYLLTLFSNMLTNLDLTDMETCYKVFKADVIKRVYIKENRFGVEPEITAKISKMNVRIYEIGISYYGRTYEQGKKIGWKDGVRAVWCILKYNFKFISKIFIIFILCIWLARIMISHFFMMKSSLRMAKEMITTYQDKTEIESLGHLYKFYPEIAAVKQFCINKKIQKIQVKMNGPTKDEINIYYHPKVFEMIYPVMIKRGSDHTLYITIRKERVKSVALFHKKRLLYKK